MLSLWNLNVSHGQSILSDSIQILQHRSLNGICKEIKELSDNVSKIDSTKFASTKISISDEPIDYDSIDQIISTNVSLLKENTFGGFIKSILGHILGALIGVWLALHLFGKKRKAELAAIETQKDKRLEEKRKYLVTTIKAAISTSIKTKRSIDKFADKIEQDPLYIESLEIFPLQVFERLQKIVNNEEYFHSFLDKYGDSEESIESFRLISNSSDFLDSQLKQLYIKDYKEKDHQKKILYKDTFDEVLLELREIGISSFAQFQQTNDQVFKDIHDDIQVILGAYQNGLEEGARIDYHHNNFVLPALHLINNKYFLHTQLRLSLYKLGKCAQIFNHIQLQNRKVAFDMKNHFEYITEVNEVLKEQLKFMGEDESLEETEKEEMVTEKNEGND